VATIVLPTGFDRPLDYLVPDEFGDPRRPASLLDYLTANILLPLGGFLIALFVGWRMTERSVQSELRLRLGFVYSLWYFLVRYVAPVAILVVFLRAVGLI
jgi:SNF family Na+-dependent transporter